jgi:hypothetical protein
VKLLELCAAVAIKSIQMFLKSLVPTKLIGKLKEILLLSIETHEV